MSAFEEAFRKALEVHWGQHTGEVDGALLDESFATAWVELVIAAGDGTRSWQPNK